MRRALATCLFAACALPAARATETQDLVPPKQHWSFSGPLGTIDPAAAQRGFQIYNEVCSACHSMRLMSYRNLEGIGLSPAQVKAVAASKTVAGEPDDNGKPTTRPALPSDRFASPFPNDRAARAANNGALPPDQSTLLKARPGGADYIYAILTGYQDPPPPGVKIPDGTYYNKYFPGHAIHMPPPLSDGAVTFDDGTKATLAQEAHDVTTFLYYASHPENDARKRLGVRVVGFLVLMAGVVFGVKKRVWRDLH